MAFTYTQVIAIDHTKCGTVNATNFPMLFAGTYDGTGGTPDLRTVANGGRVMSSSGYDIGFYADAALTVKLNWETVAYDATTGAVQFWVQIPTLSAGVDTVIYMGYGDAAITTDQSNRTGTWDSNYKGVWHLQDNAASTAVAEATGTANAASTASANTSTLTATGRVGKGFLFSSTAGFITLAGAVLTTGSPFTLSWWEHITADTNAFPARFILLNSGGTHFLVLRPNGSATSFYRHITWGDSPQSNPPDAGLFQAAAVPVAPASGNGGWHHFCITGTAPEQRSTANTALFLDGVTQTVAQSAGASAGTIAQNRIGWDGADNGPDATMDEIRISTGIRRAADWALAEFNNQNSPSTFYSFTERTTNAIVPRNVMRPRPFQPGIAR